MASYDVASVMVFIGPSRGWGGEQAGPARTVRDSDVGYDRAVYSEARGGVSVFRGYSDGRGGLTVSDGGGGVSDAAATVCDGRGAYSDGRGDRGYRSPTQD